MSCKTFDGVFTKTRRTLALGAALSALLFMVVYANLPRIPYLYGLVSKPALVLPKYRDATYGKWIPSPQGIVDADLWNMFRSCHPDFSPAAGGSDGRDKEEEQKIRGRKVASWEWILEDGNPPREWDTEAFIERALKSRGGFVVIGDSVAGQMMGDLQTLLRQHRGDHPRQVTERIHLEDNNIFISISWLTLSPKNPLFERLLAKPSLAEVPRTRFSEPILTMYRSDNLLTEGELDDILKSVGMVEPLNRKVHRATGDWRQGLRNISRGTSWPGELDTIVIVNTGPHYSPLHMTPANDDQLIKSYEIVIKTIYNFLSAPPVPTLTFFRATSPAHQNCGAYSQPVFRNSSTAENPTPEWHNYGWHMFPEFNRIAKKVFADQSSTTRYLDIWPLSVQRPDAHTGWNVNQFDCLHWCQPSVTAWWVRNLWHTIQEEGL